MTLEWLLIVAAIAGLAAVSALAVQRAIDDSTDLPPDPEIRIIDAEIEAARVAHEATESMKASYNTYTSVDAGFRRDCTAIANSFADVLDPLTQPVWTSPTRTGSAPDYTYTSAKCILTRKP